MNPNEEAKPNVLELFKGMLEEHIGKKVLEAHEVVIKYVKGFETKAVADIQTLIATVTAKIDEMKAEAQADLASFKSEAITTLQSALAPMREEHAARMRQVEARLAAPVKDGKDADETAITARVTESLSQSLRAPITEDVQKNLPILGEPIRDALELLPEGDKLLISAIEGLREELDDLKKQGKLAGAGGGSMGLSVGHWPLHEAFTMDGVATTVTLTQGGIGAAGNAVWVRYQGQLLDHGVQYTVSGNKVTLVGFTPEVDTVVSVTYFP